jgi:hypothetical protein
MNIRPRREPLLYLILALSAIAWPSSTRRAQAQLATSFYNVTGIQTRVLPNAVRITIQTDGTLRYGGDFNDWLNFDPFGLKPTTSLRLRLHGARAKLPAFVNIGTYPVESAVVTPGTVDLVSPYIHWRDWSQLNPKVDIEFRFFVPVRVQRFMLNDQDDITFSRVLGPLDSSVEMAEDKRSIILTVVPDRTDFDAAKRLQRSPKENWKQRLSVTPLGEATSTRYRVDALHTPLPQVLDAAAQAMKLRFVGQSGVADADVSLFLPDATPEEFMRTLGAGYNLVFRAGEAGEYEILRPDAMPLERIALQHLAPERARLLLPDFLLPVLRTDSAQSALLVAAAPAVVERVRRDLALLDRPRPQVRVEATAWEFASNEEARAALSVARITPNGLQQFDAANGAFSLEIGPNEIELLRVRLEALSALGRVRLAARPNIVVASGESGTLFLGQSRYVQVLQRIEGTNQPRALPVQVGYTLQVTPRAGATDDITLELSPRVSTIDEIENGSGLPTLGIREASSTVRVRPQDAVILGGLEADLRFETRRRPFLARVPLLGRLFRSRRGNNQRSTTVLLVTARKV